MRLGHPACFLPTSSTTLLTIFCMAVFQDVYPSVCNFNALPLCEIGIDSQCSSPKCHSTRMNRASGGGGESFLIFSPRGRESTHAAGRETLADNCFFKVSVATKLAANDKRSYLLASGTGLFFYTFCPAPFFHQYTNYIPSFAAYYQYTCLLAVQVACTIFGSHHSNSLLLSRLM